MTKNIHGQTESIMRALVEENCGPLQMTRDGKITAANENGEKICLHALAGRHFAGQLPASTAETIVRLHNDRCHREAHRRSL